MPRMTGVGVGLKRYRVTNFGGGLDVRTSPVKMSTDKQDKLTMANDVVYTTSGGVSRRTGSVPILITPLGTPIIGGVHYRLSNGTEHIIVGTRDGRLVEVNLNGSITVRATGLTTDPTARYRFAVYNDLLHICNGFDAPRYWDGTAATVAVLPGSPPIGQVVVAHADRVYMTVRNSSTLYWCKINNTFDWTGTTDAGHMEVQPQDGSTLIDLVPSIQELVLLKGNRPYRLQGIGPATGYTIADHLVPTTGSVGAISTMGAAFALNNVWYVSTLGLHGLSQTNQFGDLSESFPSDQIDPYFRTYSSRFSLSINRLPNCVLRYDSQQNLLYLTADSDDDNANDLTLVYDLVRKAWSVWRNTPWATTWMVRNATDGSREVWAGDYTGQVYALNRRESIEGINGQIRHITALGEPGIVKSLRYGIFYFDAEASGSVTVTTRTDYGLSGGQHYSANVASTGATWGTTFTWGVSHWGSVSQMIVRLDMTGLGEVVETIVKNSDPQQPWTLLGYEYWYRDRRAIRR